MKPSFVASFCLAAVALGFSALQASAEAAPPKVETKSFVFEKAPFPECHASTIESTKAGLVVAFFGGKKEKDPTVGIWVSRKDTGATSWTAPIEVANGIQADGKRLPCWNPVLTQAPIQKDGSAPLLLFYKIGPSPSEWWGMLRTSSDHGLTWSQAERLPEGILGPIKNKPLWINDSTLLCPTSTESNDERDAWRVHFEKTTDLGKTWTKVAPPEGESGQKPLDAIQPSFLKHSDGRLQALGRTRNKALFQTWSKDGGASWSPMALLPAVPNPNSGTDAITLKDGRHCLVANPVTAGRSPLQLLVSQNGVDWKPVLTLEEEKGKEFSYPAIIQAADGTIHITYTWKRQRVAHVALSPAQF